ncbi:hypothetical protein ACTHQY_04500 [Rhodococcoides corynebacterioides]|uniref:hypothetical protein n=1 Tax=Rhodococcoides corynebacterioides TaxID=53972 RepID=UPI003F82018B
MQETVQQVTEHADEGVRFTQGWGSVGTIVVALLALTVALIYNRRTLASAAARHRTDREDSWKRHRTDRRDSFNAQVRDAAVGVSTAVIEWGSIASEFRVTMKIMADSLDEGRFDNATQAENHARTRDDALRPAERRMRGALYTVHLLNAGKHIDPHVSAMLTTVDELRPLLNGIDYIDTSSVRSGIDTLGALWDSLDDAHARIMNNAREHFTFALPDKVGDSATSEQCRCARRGGVGSGDRGA